METISVIELCPSEAFKRMQDIREKVHLDFATYEEIEELNELENMLMDSVSIFQSEFRA